MSVLPFMAGKSPNNKEGSGLTEEHERKIDIMLERLLAYFQTPEGIALSEQIHDFLERQKARQRESIENLTETEKRAFAFIRSELARGHSPSVREVTQAIGLKSSRPGFRVIEGLTRKRSLIRVSNSSLEIPSPLKT